MINFWVLFSLVITLAVLLTFILYVLPRDWQELKREDGGKIVRGLRYVIISVTLAVLLFSVIPVAYQFTRLEASTALTFQNVAGLSSSLRLLSFGIGWIAIHVITDIYSYIDKRR